VTKKGGGTNRTNNYHKVREGKSGPRAGVVGGGAVGGKRGRGETGRVIGTSKLPKGGVDGGNQGKKKKQKKKTK